MQSAVERSSDAFTTLEWRFTYRFSLIASRMGSVLAPSHRTFDLSVATWRVLAVIARYQPLSAKDLARRTSTDPFRITRSLATLTRHGLISREPDLVDRRKVSLRLTRTGHRVHDEIAGRLSDLERSILQALNTQERRTLFRLLDKLDSRIEEVLFGEAE